MAEMVTFLITSLFIVVVLSVVLYFWQKPSAPVEIESQLPPLHGRGLFEETSDSLALTEDPEISEAESVDILSRAQSGEKSALQDARKSRDLNLYDQALSSLVARAEGPHLLSLVSYVCRNELPVSSKLAEKFLESWKKIPGRDSIGEMLHLAALSDDARTYRTAVEVALHFWLTGKLSAVSAEELKAMIDGEFWVLSSQTRTSGAGFLLKETLANARRELEAARSANSPLPNRLNERG